MNLPTELEAQKLLEEHVPDEYQRYHAKMAGETMRGYGKLFGEDEHLWFLTGYLHDIDFAKYPDTHPGESLRWFKDWHYPEELIHAVEAHAYGYNGFTTLPKTRLAAALLACDEICGIFYAYRKLNPVLYKDIKSSSIKKRFNDKTFAAKIERGTIMRGCESLGVSLDDHIVNVIKFLGEMK